MREVFRHNITLGSYVWGVLMICLMVLLTFDSIEEGRYLATVFFWGILVVTWYFSFHFNRYWIDDSMLFVRSIEGTKKIEIKTIRKMELDKIEWLGTILIPYKKGMIVHYNKFDSIFISPENQDDFIDKLKDIGPTINIIKKNKG